MTRDDVETFCVEQKACIYRDCIASMSRSVEKGHGRIETRLVTAIGDIGWLQDLHGWAGLRSVVMVESRREIIGGKTERETRLYIISLPPDAGVLAEAVRSHWGVEAHHWVMDMLFRVMPEACCQHDECRIRTANAPANFSTIKHMAGNLLRHGKGKQSLRVKRKMYAWNDDYLASLIAG